MSRRSKTPLAVLALVVVATGLYLCGPARADSPPTFRWPWAGSEGWRYTQGFHSDYALDFQPQIAPNCGDPIDTAHTIRPVAPGTVTAVRMRGAPEPSVPTGLIIDHGGGWSSYYTHLANVPAAVASVGASVDSDTDLGNPSCYHSCAGGVGPPCATGRHIHVQIRKDGSGAGIREATICGWTVGADSGLTRNGVTYHPDKSGSAPIANASCPTGQPTTPTPPAGPSRGDANCDLHVNAIDATVLLQYSSGLSTTICSMDQADSDGNGSINPIDAQLVLQFSAGIITQLPSL